MRAIAHTKFGGGGNRGPALSFDFINSGPTGDARITTSRSAGGATYFDQTGTLQLANANTQRIDYGPTPAVTNYIRNSTMQGAFPGTPGTDPTFWGLAGGNGLTKQIVGTGTESGIPYIDVRYFGTATSGNFSISFDYAVASQNQQWNTSYYIKLVAGATTNCVPHNQMFQATSAGAYIGDIAGQGAITPTSAGLSTQRTSFYGTASDPSVGRVYCGVIFYTAAGAVDVTLRIGGTQLEMSGSAGVFVPTSGTVAQNQTTNWIAYSQAFTSWSPVLAQLADNFAVAPDGTTTASRIRPTATTGDHFATIGVTGGATIGATYTFSVYAKSNGYNYIRMDFGNAAGMGGYVFFNVLSGGVGTNSGAYTATSSTAGNGWFRCTITAKATTSGLLNADIYVTSADNQFSWLANGANSVFVYGAQVELSTVASKYVPTSGSVATVGALPVGLMQEESRTNLNRNPRAEQATAGVLGSGGVLPLNWTNSLVVNGLSGSVVGTGYESGIPYCDIRLNGTASATGISYIVFDGGTFPATPGQIYTGSVYGRLIAGNNSGLTDIKMQVEDHGGTGGATGATSLLSVTSNLLPSQRFSNTHTVAGTSTYIIQTLIFFYNSAAVIDITLRVGGPQTEQCGLYNGVTSLILPPVGTPAASTRAEDNLTYTLAAEYNGSAVSMSVDYIQQQTAGGNTALVARLEDAGANTSKILIAGGALASNVGGIIMSSGAASINSPDTKPIMLGVSNRFTMSAQNGGAYYSSLNNGTVFTGSGVVLPSAVTLTKLRLGGTTPSLAPMGGYIRQVRLWTRGLPATEVQAV